MIASRIWGGWVSEFFVMLCDGKQGGEWYFMKGRNVTVKKNHKAFFCTIVRRSGFHRTLMVSSHVSMVIAFLLSFCTYGHFLIR